MIIRLDTTSSVPIYVQLRNEIVIGIGRGDLKIGEGLPTVRQMAEDIGVNAMTVNKAYAILKQEGYIEIDRRRGAIVRPTTARDDAFRERVEGELALLITESTLKGIERDRFMELCGRIFDGLRIADVARGEA